METTGEIISAMQAAAPPHQDDLDDTTLATLGRLTKALLKLKPDATEEYERFLAIRERGIAVPSAQLQGWLQGRNVLVVGGTGCIGSRLIEQMQAYQPRQITSVSRGERYAWAAKPGVIYQRLDIRKREQLKDLMAEVRPDIVFNLAGQREPGLAERQVHRTVTTNIFGARNVMAAAATSGAEFVVHASTGKAMRPYSRDVYAATKRIAEFVAEQMRDRSRNYSAVRFTHIVDNSIVHERLRQPGQSKFFRLHGPDVVFYAQSAKESAQLMLVAGLASAQDSLSVHAIRDLGWPVSLLDVAIGALRQAGSGIPVYFSGFDRGYDDTVRPDLYDPATGGDVSPLFNKFEAARAEPSSAATDMFPLRLPGTQRLGDAITALERTCLETEDAQTVRAALDSAAHSCLLTRAGHQGGPASSGPGAA